MAEVFTNLARSTLASGIAAGASSLTVASGDGNLLFPAAPGAGSDFFRCILFKKTTGDIEIINVTARSADVFTITRAQEEIGNITPAVAYAFDAGDIVELRPTKAFFDSLGAVAITDVQSLDYNFGADGGSANAYDVPLSPVPASYTAPLRIAWVAANTNTGPSTLIETTLAGTPKNLVLFGGGALTAGDVEVSKLALAIYDGSEFVLLNPRVSLTDDVAKQSSANTFTATNTFSDVDINGGAMDGAVIGGSSPAAITGTTLKANSTLQLALGTTVNDIDTSMAGTPTDNQLLTAHGISEYVAAEILTGSVIASRTSATDGHLEFEVASGVGIMVAWGVHGGGAGGGTVTYEKAFSSTPWVVAVTAQDNAGGSSAANASLDAKSSTQFSYGASSATDSIHYIAIGPTTP